MHICQTSLLQFRRIRSECLDAIRVSSFLEDVEGRKADCSFGGTDGREDNVDYSEGEAEAVGE